MSRALLAMIVRGNLPPGPPVPAENEVRARVEWEEAVCLGGLFGFAAKATADPLATDWDPTD